MNPKKTVRNAPQNGVQKATDRSDRYILLYELFHSISSTLEPREALELIIDAAVRITGASNALLSLVDWERKVLDIQVSRGYNSPVRQVKLEVGAGITGWVAETAEPALIQDVAADPRYYPLGKETKSELAVPLLIEERVIGVVNVESTRRNAFDDDDLEFLTLLAKQSAQVIRNSQLFDTVQRKVAELSSLIEVNKTIARTLSLEQTLNHIVERAATLMAASLCTVRLLTEDKQELALEALYGVSADEYERQNIRVQDSLTGQVVLTQKPLQVADVKQEPRYLFHRFAQRQQLCSLLSVPLKSRNRVIGVLNINKSELYRFSDEEVKLVRTFADLCAIAIENARLFETTMSLEEQTRKAERLAVVGELAVGIAHEIRNPLTIIKMIFESDAGSFTSMDLEIISVEMERMNKIISRFLDFAKPTEPVHEMCSISTILHNALLLLSHAVEKKHIKLRLEEHASLPDISADPVQLQQVFLNLLLNSIEALSAGGSILVRTRVKDERWAEVRIQDNGPGLAPKVKTRLFTPFTTTKANGLGLGLSIIKRIVDSHNGELEIESSAKSGTRTTIRLPMLCVLKHRC